MFYSFISNRASRFCDSLLIIDCWEVHCYCNTVVDSSDNMIVMILSAADFVKAVALEKNGQNQRYVTGLPKVSHSAIQRVL